MYDMPLYQGSCDEKPEYKYYPGSFSYKYPVAGEVNSKVKVISYDVETRALKEMNVPLDYDGYVNKIEFGKTPERLMVNTLNRNQNEMKALCRQSTVGNGEIDLHRQVDNMHRPRLDIDDALL